MSKSLSYAIHHACSCFTALSLFGTLCVWAHSAWAEFGELQKLLASDMHGNEQSGCSVAISGTWLVVGAPHFDNGAVSVFERAASGSCVETQKLLASDGQLSDWFGYSVAISGDWLVVGAPYEDTSSYSDNGAAYVFERDTSGNWVETQKLLASELQSRDYFGYSVAISGDRLVVGAYAEDTYYSQNGAAYVFEPRSIFLSPDRENPYACAVIFRVETDTLYLTGTLPTGFQGVSRADFRLQVSAPAGFYFGYAAPSGAHSIGNPIDLTPENPSDPAGTSVFFDPCITGPPGTMFDLGHVVAHNGFGGTSSIVVQPKIPPDIPTLDYVLLYECDDPIFTPHRALCQGPLPINSAECVEPPPTPLGVAAAVTESTLVVSWEAATAPQVVGYNIYRAVDGGPTELLGYAAWLDTTYVDSGIIGTQSHCYEIAALDLVGRESPPSDPACLAPFSRPRNLLVSPKVRPQQALLRWTRPRLGHPNGYAVYRSGEKINPTTIPDTTYVDTSPVAGNTCYAVVGVNSTGLEGTLSPETCVFVWLTQSLPLDSHDDNEDGTAGPIMSPQPLFAGQQYLITVQGTYSLWPATTWKQPGRIICGIPETTPTTPSPGVENYWVGLDAEWRFAAVLPPGSNCAALDSLGLGPLPNHFQIDLGDGFHHLEPLGGHSTGPSPDHTYRYLVTGQDSLARFALFDSTTSDNYGVLTITIEEVTTILTDQHPPAPPTRFAVLPNLPNPFNPSTEIRYQLPVASRVTVTIHDVRGRLLRRVFAGEQSQGEQSTPWDGKLETGTPAPSGTYIVRVTTPSGTGTRKLVLLR